MAKRQSAASTVGSIVNDAVASSTIDPSKPSSDYSYMLPYWDKVEALLGGTETMRLARETYLPRFLNEEPSDYNYRVGNAKFTNIFRDIAENLASKPFTRDVLIEDASVGEALKELALDIDGKGNTIHTFAATVFFQGIVDAVDWIFVDKAPVAKGATLADEARLGVRPYWVHVPAKCMIAAYSDIVDGKEQFVHIRMLEYDMVRDGFSEREVKRVRELDRPLSIDPESGKNTYGPAVWRLWEEIVDPKTKKKRWVVVDGGEVGIGIIAAVPFIAGRRKGNSWRFHPMLKDAADLQVKHYQYETNLDAIKEVACFPMLAAEGVDPPTDKEGNFVPLVVGPRKVLYAPPNPGGGAPGRWSYVQPSAETMKFLAEDVKSTEQQLRELGRQPLTANSGNLTVVTTAFAAQKGNSAIQACAMNLKSALELAMEYTCSWIGDDTSDPKIIVHTDFDIETGDDKGPDFVMKLRENGDISRSAVLSEAMRRNFLSSDFDPEEDEKQLDEEEASKDHTEEDVNNALLLAGNTPPIEGEDQPPGPGGVPPVKKPPANQ